MTKNILAIAMLTLAIGTSALYARGFQEERKGSETTHEESELTIIARWANFVVLFAGLAYLLRKPLGEFFQSRRKDIATGLKRAEDAHTSAQARMTEIEQRLARLGSEIAGLRAEAEKESLIDREKILAEAKRDVERIVDHSRQEIERVARTMERQIKENIADQVIGRAGNALRTEMTQDDQKRVIVRFIKKL